MTSKLASSKNMNLNEKRFQKAYFRGFPNLTFRNTTATHSTQFISDDLTFRRHLRYFAATNDAKPPLKDATGTTPSP